MRAAIAMDASHDDEPASYARRYSQARAPEIIQNAFFNAATANAFTTVFAGFALTTTSFPKISRLPARVAGFLRVFTMHTPGIVNLAAFLSSVVAIPPRLAITFEHSDFFKP